ncbi:MAG: SRPBCC family protein [Bacteroidetes bacterium]|nr:SRPBCC family protein [Bacteroidota bacterium]
MYTFERIQTIAAPINELWNFMSSPFNLQKITPPYMGFNIINKDLPEKMYAGMIISYKVSPLMGIKMKWVTEITHVKEMKYFVDVQQEGPYRFWHHEHHFEVSGNGVLITDILNYSPPFGIIGKFANKFLIEKKLNEIFEFRKLKLNQIFG